MAKSKATTSFLGDVFTLGLYKPSQGKLTRQLTALALALIVFVGAYTLSQGWLSTQPPGVRIGIPWTISLVGLWLIFRAVNYPPFAEFLISVEAEMDKVSWASRTELYRATIVVICMMFFLGAILYVYDMLWYQILSALRVLRL